ISDTLAAWNAILTQAGNDFMCSQMVDDTLFATWGDTRNGRLNIYFVKYDLRNLVSTGIHQLGSEQLPDIEVWPNPTSDWLHVRGTGIVRLKLSDANGRVVRDVTAGPLSLRDLAAGNYLLKVETEGGKFTTRVLKQ
ncbi:MAG TPA: T9SS type A sorting domain-containing protein, partial [Bacteroidia bacterium]|nr:T9SS type A sorting domain-containing protein [Bacteroidia bacterium]